MSDLHLHTSFSFDCEEDAENYIIRAISFNERVLGFSEHYDFDVVLEGEGKRDLPDLDKYFERVSALREKYSGKIKILRGLELGYSRAALPEYKRILEKYPLDYTILSVHTLPERGDCYYPEFYSGLTKNQAYLNYLKAVLESVESGLNFNILGHLGYVARYARYQDNALRYGEFKEITDNILKALIAFDKSLEINTSVGGSGMRYLPDEDIIDRYLELGGKNFTLGSDSHGVKNFTRRFEEVKNYLAEKGAPYVLYYENLKPVIACKLNSLQ